MAGGNSNYNELKDRVAALEELLGMAENSDDGMSVVRRIQNTNTDTELARFREIMEIKMAKYDGFRQELLTQVEDLKKENENLNLEVTVLRRALAGVNVGREAERSKVRIPEPKAFAGSRSARDLENFLYDMERYFSAAHIPEDDQVEVVALFSYKEKEDQFKEQMAILGNRFFHSIAPDGLAGDRPESCSCFRLFI